MYKEDNTSDYSTLAIACLALAVTALIFVGKMDYEDQVLLEQHYCQMVSLWETDKEAGIPELNRAGWPPYKGEEVYCSEDQGNEYTL